MAKMKTGLREPGFESGESAALSEPSVSTAPIHEPPSPKAGPADNLKAELAELEAEVAGFVDPYAKMKAAIAISARAVARSIRH